jgi:hypothetical protein
MSDTQPPAKAYEALAADRADRWGYTETLDPDDLAGYIRAQADDDNVRADVDTVWRLAVQAERDRVRRLLTRPGLNAIRAIQDGEIRQGCVVMDGATVREELRQAYLAIRDGKETT